MGFFSKSTIMEYCSGVWKHMIQKKYYVISTMDQPGDILWVTKYNIKSCRSDFTGLVIQGCSCLCAQVFGLTEVCRHKQEVNHPFAGYCNKRTFSIVGPGYYWRNISTFIEVVPLYPHCYRLFHAVGRCSFVQTGQ